MFDRLHIIEKFYYSDFWKDRFKRRLKEEGFRYYPLELDCILGVITCVIEDTTFDTFDKDISIRGSSNKGTTISLNINLCEFDDVIMHELGHRLYNQQEFKLIEYLNKLIIKSPELYLNESLTERDYSYFTNDNELRQRIIVIIKNMYDNNWTIEETYNNIKDDIKDIFTKEYIIHLIENIL